jgi:hypothetical protein
MRARIYKPARNAMQSGQARTKKWVLEFTAQTTRTLDPLMGWTSSSDTQSQVRMYFESDEAAIAYATEHGIEHTVQQPKVRAHNIRQGGYGANFASTRRTVWTH